MFKHALLALLGVIGAVLQGCMLVGGACDLDTMNECLDNATAANLGVCELPLRKRDCVVNNKCCYENLPNKGGNWAMKVSDWVSSTLHRDGTCDFSAFWTCYEEPTPYCESSTDMCHSP
ncbi:unnamed protein product [Symbiodinium sp. CCMP2592]|nr:unnamed protein product [Symbiodinium sp. CCMP2592]